MRPWLVALATPLGLLWACSFDTTGIGGGDEVDGGRTPVLPDASPWQRDASRPPPDGSSPPPDGQPPVACEAGRFELPFEPTNIARCVLEPAGALDLSVEVEVDTDAATIRDVDNGGDPAPLAVSEVIAQSGGAPDILVVSYDSLRVRSGAVLHGIGSRALVLVSRDDIRIDSGGRITVHARRDLPGAGASGSACAEHGGRGADGERQEYDDDDHGGSGGGGGGYGSSGGTGAEVQGSDGDVSPGGSADSDSAHVLEPLRGGCAGGDGYAESEEQGSGVGGAGGGAIQLVSAQEIRVSGTVSGSGGGGAAGARKSGGGGGGSGGAVLLEARLLDIRGALTANGGGGGQGMRRIGSGSCGSPEDGRDGYRTLDLPAPGGDSGCSTSGAGGDGDAATVEGAEDGEEGDSDHDGDFGDTSPTAAGGGGGGGGVGRIRISACQPIVISDPTLSPAPAADHDLQCE